MHLVENVNDSPSSPLHGSIPINACMLQGKLRLWQFDDLTPVNRNQGCVTAALDALSEDFATVL